MQDRVVPKSLGKSVIAGTEDVSLILSLRRSAMTVCSSVQPSMANANFGATSSSRLYKALSCGAAMLTGLVDIPSSRWKLSKPAHQT